MNPLNPLAPLYPLNPLNPLNRYRDHRDREDCGDRGDRYGWDYAEYDSRYYKWITNQTSRIQSCASAIAFNTKILIFNVMVPYRCHYSTFCKEKVKGFGGKALREVSVLLPKLEPRHQSTINITIIITIS